MPRPPDPQLENQILNAARKLFLKGGEKKSCEYLCDHVDHVLCLSMRSLAKAAHTNTPAVYRRYKSRKQILGALVQRIQLDLSAVLGPCVSLHDAHHRLLDFSRPNFEFIRRRSAEWLGGTPEDHTGLVLALWALVHGTASLLISGAVPPIHEAAALCCG